MSKAVEVAKNPVVDVHRNIPVIFSAYRAAFIAKVEGVEVSHESYTGVTLLIDETIKSATPDREEKAVLVIDTKLKEVTVRGVNNKDGMPLITYLDGGSLCKRSSTLAG